MQSDEQEKYKPLEKFYQCFCFLRHFQRLTSLSEAKTKMIQNYWQEWTLHWQEKMYFEICKIIVI